MVTANPASVDRDDDFKLHTKASEYKRPKRKPMSIGASSCSSAGRFRARPMPCFDAVSPRKRVLLADKSLTQTFPFQFETEKRSETRLQQRPKKPQMVHDSASEKENNSLL